MTEQKLENVIASVRVSNALLAEPLRIYCRTMANVPALGDRELEEVAGPGPLSSVMLRYRNIVFHVGSDGIDPTASEIEFLDQMKDAMDSPSLLPRLLRFFMEI